MNSNGFPLLKFINQCLPFRFLPCVVEQIRQPVDGLRDIGKLFIVRHPFFQIGNVLFKSLLRFVFGNLVPAVA